MNVKNFALVLGVVYLIAGILGFVPSLLQEPGINAPELAVTASYGYFLGLFPVNVLHNLFHLAIGLWGVLAARHIPMSRTFAQSLAIIYGTLTIFGLIPGLNTLFGLIPLHGHDVWLHALTALAAAYFGFRTEGREDFVEHGTVTK